MSALRVMVVGAAGRMGSEVVRAVSARPDMELVAAVDRQRVGEDAVQVAGAVGPAVIITDSMPTAIQQGEPEVAVDFTLPDSVMDNAATALAVRLPYVIGTSGITEGDLQELSSLCEQHSTPALVIPNFAIGAVLMMRFAAQAARYFEAVEVIELHHAGKVDAPSGTARATAKLLDEAGIGSIPPPEAQPARGLAEHGVQVHSVRLPGLIAHQEVIFGGLGQTLTIRHDSTSRESFMPGVLLALRRVRELRGLTVGLDKVM